MFCLERERVASKRPKGVVHVKVLSVERLLWCVTYVVHLANVDRSVCSQMIA